MRNRSVLMRLTVLPGLFLLPYSGCSAGAGSYYAYSADRYEPYPYHRLEPYPYPGPYLRPDGSYFLRDYYRSRYIPGYGFYRDYSFGRPPYIRDRRYYRSPVFPDRRDYSPRTFPDRKDYRPRTAPDGKRSFPRRHDRPGRRR